ncbi:MAG: hypothetical protein GY771_14920, partial [bacterium]|nr:hypothetical protein [bacterium]
MRRLLLIAAGLTILLTAIAAEAGYLDRKNTFLLEAKVGYQLPRDDNLLRVYDGGISATGLAGYNLTGHIAVLGKATYRNYHIKSSY